MMDGSFETTMMDLQSDDASGEGCETDGCEDNGAEVDGALDASGASPNASLKNIGVALSCSFLVQFCQPDVLSTVIIRFTILIICRVKYTLTFARRRGRGRRTSLTAKHAISTISMKMHLN